MKNYKFQIMLLMVIALLSVNTSLFAQRGNGGWGQNSNYGRLFNSQTIETINGTITAVERILPNTKMSYGLHLKVKTNTETISVHLGPTWYLDNQDIQFKKGDVISITGSRITYQKAPAVIASKVIKNEDVLNLRDKNGFPSWSGWRKKGMMRNRKRNMK